jgi:hypothetical protein
MQMKYMHIICSFLIKENDPSGNEHILKFYLIYQDQIQN